MSTAIWVHADQAEEGCHPGPESREFMADLQILARYPAYGIILNVIPSILDLKAVSSWPTCKYLPDIQPTE
jgi:hypothetical protein